MRLRCHQLFSHRSDTSELPNPKHNTTRWPSAHSHSILFCQGALKTGKYDPASHHNEVPLHPPYVIYPHNMYNRYQAGSEIGLMHQLVIY